MDQVKTINTEVPSLRLAPENPPASRVFPRDIRAGKNTTAYRAHSYHTKVPYEAILPFIEHYTNPGDLVLDPFCGSGMTGLAAITVGRNALLIDTAPSAVHIAENYVTACDSHALTHAGCELLSAIGQELADLYRTMCDRCQGPASVEYTVWSDIFECKDCGSELSYWDVAVDRSAHSVRRTLQCSRCGKYWKKQQLLWKNSVPVSTKYSCLSGCRGLIERPITANEMALSNHVETDTIFDWYPTAPFGRDREMWRASHEVMGIRSVDGFYTRRNLRVLAALWREIRKIRTHRLEAALRFVFTSVVNRASRRYQWNANRPTNVQTGTLYISSLNYEWNVLSLFRRKLADSVRFYKEHPCFKGKALVARGSAIHLASVNDESVDYIFTDPPFGGNIYYGDCALLWESWLGQFTDSTEELVINSGRKQKQNGKSLEDYKNLIARAFSEMHRVLKPGRSASIVFHSAHPEVWEAIQESLISAGFDLVNTCALDKGQPSIKGLKGRRDEERVAAFDIIMNVCKQQPRQAKISGSPSAFNVRPFLAEKLREYLVSLSPQAESQFSSEKRSTQYLHSLAVRALLDQRLPLHEVSFQYVEKLCREHFELRDGCWYLQGQVKAIGNSPQQDLFEHVRT